MFCKLDFPTHSGQQAKHGGIGKARMATASERASFAVFDARLVPGRMAPVPTVDIDLDQPPEQRWAWVSSYQLHFQSARNLVLGHFGVAPDSPTPLYVRAAARVLLAAVPATFRAELDACAAACGVSSGELALLNYLYEIAAKCSSFIVERPDGRPLHARTLDWPGCAVLCACTVRVRFKRSGAVLYESVTWPGYLGVLTACAPGRFSVSVNFRAEEKTASSWAPSGPVASTVAEGMRRVKAMLATLSGTVRSVGFAVRDLLEATPLVNFEGAVDALSTVRLVAPVYLTICGIHPGEGATLIRGPAGTHLCPHHPCRFEMRTCVSQNPVPFRSALCCSHVHTRPALPTHTHIARALTCTA